VADTARRLPGVEAFEGRLRGAAVRARDLPIADYDALNVAKVTARPPELSQAELGTVAAYERRHRRRTTVLERIASLREDEPWAGYDALTATQAVERLREADKDTRHARRGADYEAVSARRDAPGPCGCVAVAPKILIAVWHVLSRDCSRSGIARLAGPILSGQASSFIRLAA
jgi:hypothetical protein